VFRLKAHLSVYGRLEQVRDANASSDVTRLLKSLTLDAVRRVQQLYLAGEGDQPSVAD